MFYVLPPGNGAASLEKEDELVFFKAYGTSQALAATNRISGAVTSGLQADVPVPGAIVYAIDAASGDTVAADYTLPDGSYTFVGMDDGSYYIAIHPLDGTAAILLSRIYTRYSKPGTPAPFRVREAAPSGERDLLLPANPDFSEIARALIC